MVYRHSATSILEFFETTDAVIRVDAIVMVSIAIESW